MNTPWNSIAESIVNNETGRNLKFSDALISPCATCATSPCCSHLPLNVFAVTNLLELDHALYLLNFDHIKLGLSASGDWSAYYTFPCRFLDRNTFDCTVHSTPDHPQICVHFNPYNCWYKRVFTTAGSDEFIPIDRNRVALLVSAITFDEERQIVSVPAWETIVEMMRTFEDQKRVKAPEPLLAEPMIEAWGEAVVQGTNVTNDSSKTLTYDSFSNPCSGCGAHCCKTLVFPQNAPTHISNFDYLRFSLGFPGLELGIADGSWSLIVKTTCCHLKDNLCSIFEQPERPLICKYYDGWKCQYKPQFGLPRPHDFMRVRLEQFPWLIESFQFNQQGNLLEMPPLEAMRQHIEARWQQHGRLGTDQVGVEEDRDVRA